MVAERSKLASAGANMSDLEIIHLSNQGEDISVKGLAKAQGMTILVWPAVVCG